MSDCPRAAVLAHYRYTMTVIQGLLLFGALAAYAVVMLAVVIRWRE